MTHQHVCSLCSELCASRTQIVFPTHCPEGGLLAIGEAPGSKEDLQGTGFVGAAGKTLDVLLAAHGMGRHDYGRANIVRCRPLDNRKPKQFEVDNCMPKLAQCILECKPSVLLLVGATPTVALLGAGLLSQHIQDFREGLSGKSRFAHPGLSTIRHLASELAIVPMPHTSPLAFNRNAPDGRKWAAVAKEQVAMAVAATRTKQSASANPTT